jgi:hypothetical protein
MKTIGADRGYDAAAFLLAVEAEGVTPLVALRAGPIRGCSAPAQARRRARRRQKTRRHQVAQRKRKLTEEGIGWNKTVGGLRRFCHIGRWKNRQQALIGGAAYNLLRITRLLARAQCL